MTKQLLVLFSLALLLLISACASDSNDSPDGDSDGDTPDGDLPDGDIPDGDGDGDSDGDSQCRFRTDLIDAEAAWLRSATCAQFACMSDYTTVVSARDEDQPLGLPDEVVLQQGNNNLDVVEHDCRIFLAFRTAPSHFASPKTKLYVVSTEDLANWRYEGEFFMETDLREPRLLSLDGKLFLYFAVLGENMWEFKPQGMRVAQYNGPGDWTEPKEFYKPGEDFIPWRAKVIAGKAYLVTYSGGESIYEPGESALEVHWLTSANGIDWEPVVPGRPVVLTGGVSETDFAFLPDGTLVAVTRNESGEERAGGDFVWGSKICTAPPDDLGNWTCAYDLKKYDSPLVFAVDDTVYLIGRRNVADDGKYDLEQDDKSFEDQASAYEQRYWLTPKRTSLWRVNPADRSVSFVMDLPSKGDTSFASLVRVSDNLLEVFNYSSPPDSDADPNWANGQQNPTIIYRLSLSFETDTEL